MLSFPTCEYGMAPPPPSLEASPSWDLVTLEAEAAGFPLCTSDSSYPEEVAHRGLSEKISWA